jgi:protein-tyrosine phosphatase
MQSVFWVMGIGFVIGLAVWMVFQAMVRRGGRHVRLVDPRTLVVTPVDAKQDEASSLRGRFVKLEGAANFRDIGGYLTESGLLVRTGRVFRSDELSELTDGDHNKLRGLGLRRVFDLRSRDEVRKKWDRIPADAPYQYLHTPVYEKEPRWDYLPAILFRRHQLGQVLSERYYFMVEKRAEVFGRILAYFADLKNLPAVYHCNAGKDRTGIVTALVLSLLGVPDETIVADYSLSNLGFEHYFREFVEDRRHAALGVADEEFQGLFIVQPTWMRDLLAHLRQTYGSVETYLVEKGKMPPGVIDQIRANLLV